MFAALCPGEWIGHVALLRPASSQYLTLLDFSLWGSVRMPLILLQRTDTLIDVEKRNVHYGNRRLP
jgi:hypothetical protein